MKEKKVMVYPSFNSTNQYISLISKAIKNAGYEVVSPVKKIEFLCVDTFVLNWYENMPGSNVLPTFLRKIAKLFLIKCGGKQIVWVVHNKKPHDDRSGLSLLLMKILCLLSDKIIILSEETKTVLEKLVRNKRFYESKICKIPHPNYIGVYGEEKDSLINCNSTIKFLFLGMIRKYKNIELLIDVFKELPREYPVHLTIAGSCMDECYKKELELRADKYDDNITLCLKFIDDAEMVGLIQSNDILVLPYDINSSLNSGTIILGFSYHKTVISPMIGTLKEYSGSNFFYSYDYADDAEHKTKLTHCIEEVVRNITSEPDVLKRKGSVAYDLVKNSNSLNVVSGLYKKVIG